MIGFCLVLSSCSAKAMTVVDSYEKEEIYTVKWIDYISDKAITEDTALRGVWVSQFDMHPIYRDGGRQRDIEDYRQRVERMMYNLCRDGYNTVFLQLRPNGDSMYKSEIYPLSKYIAGEYGGMIGYDAVDIFIETAKRYGIVVHGWINPFRLCDEESLVNYGQGIIYSWYKEGIGKRVERGSDGILYLDPYYSDATKLIADGAREILERYDIGGIHIDDYFYPTEFEFDDREEYILSGYGDLGDFRRANINRTVKALYEVVHSFEGKEFGIAPAGNIYSLQDGWFADVYAWCGDEGYVDYIMPQLYFGFENAYCPFDRILTDWANAVTNKNIKLYIGLSAAKCALGSEGVADLHAGVGGKYEWRDSKDILARSITAINRNDRASGYCIFAYSSLYNPLTGEINPLTADEQAAMAQR